MKPGFLMHNLSLDLLIFQSHASSNFEKNFEPSFYAQWNQFPRSETNDSDLMTKVIHLRLIFKNVCLIGGAHVVPIPFAT